MPSSDIADLLGTYRDNAASSDDDGQYLARRSFVDEEEDGSPAMATFIRSGTVGYSNPKDPSTWPVHGGMKGKNVCFIPSTHTTFSNFCVH